MSESGLNAVPDILTAPQWVQDFEAYTGRPLRILNLGNIANNAFQNSKIMRRAGIDADCIAYDYYHVMGTAEWEDAEFRGQIGDQFYPDWWRVKFKNYNRPKWFIQGPKRLCLDYIHTLYSDAANPEMTKRAWEILTADTHHENYKKSTLNIFPKNPLRWPSWGLRKIKYFSFRIKTYIRSPFLFYRQYNRQFKSLMKIANAIVTILSLPFILLFFGFSFLADKFMGVLALIPKKNRSNYFELRRARRQIMVRNTLKRVYPIAYSTIGFGAALFRRITGRRFGVIFGDDMANALTEFFGIRSKSVNKITVNMSIEEIQMRRAERRKRRERAQQTQKADLSEIMMNEEVEKAQEEELQSRSIGKAYYQAYLYYLELAYPDQNWILDHYKNNADISQQDIHEDIIVANILSKEWKGVFEYYDIVLAYSTDGILSMAGSDMPYFTYEHGTLRSIPFEQNTMGRLCATSYRNCQALMITNLDNLDKPDKLGLNPKQSVYLPHAVDDKKLLGYRHAHKELQPTDDERPSFLCPARHDWGDDDPSLMKGNDKFLHATKIIYDEGYRPKIILFDWGRHVEKSRKLIDNLGIGELISWVKPMKKTELWKSYFKCHAIVDQFSIPAFGGVTFEGLTFSKRIITSIDAEQSEAFFGEAPPILNCSEPDDIAQAMRVILDDPADNAGLGHAGGLWAKKYHSSQRILDLQLAAFEPTIQKLLQFDKDGQFSGLRSNIRQYS